MTSNKYPMNYKHGILTYNGRDDSMMLKFMCEILFIKRNIVTFEIDNCPICEV